MATKQEERVIEGMAKVGYHSMHDLAWEELPFNSIERALWLVVASSMFNELRRIWEQEKIYANKPN